MDQKSNKRKPDAGLSEELLNSIIIIQRTLSNLCNTRLIKWCLEFESFPIMHYLDSLQRRDQRIQNMHVTSWNSVENIFEALQGEILATLGLIHSMALFHKLSEQHSDWATHPWSQPVIGADLSTELTLLLMCSFTAKKQREVTVDIYISILSHFVWVPLSLVTCVMTHFEPVCLRHGELSWWWSPAQCCPALWATQARKAQNPPLWDSSGNAHDPAWYSAPQPRRDLTSQYFSVRYQNFSLIGRSLMDADDRSVSPLCVGGVI